MNKYSSYKSSGVEWIGEIPETWDSGKMKYVLSNNDGGVWGSDIENEEGGNIVIRSTEITIDGNWDFSNPLKRDLTKNEIIKSKLYEGDIVITKSSGSPQHIGKSVIVSKEIELLNCCYSNFVQRIRFRNYNPKLYHFILNSDIGRSQFKYLTTTSTGLGNLNGSSLNDILLPFIPLIEQERIVKYLIEKTTIIDKLISTKQRKVELLKEQRTTLINQVITKGLNPKVKMKNSGLEWIGEIPESWSFVKLGHYTIIVRGSSPRPSGDPLYFDGDFINWITVGELTNSVGKYITHTESMLTEKGMKQSRIIEVNTLLLSNSGATLGVPKITKIKGCINDGSVGFIKIYSELSQDYLYHFLTTQTKLLREQQSGYGQPNLNIEIVSNIKLPLPSKSEQEQIVEFLDKHTKEIDDLVSMEQKKEELLKEYRQSLISEVITGKIMVVE